VNYRSYLRFRFRVAGGFARSALSVVKRKIWATLREGGVRDGIVVSSESSRDIEEHRARGTRAARTIKDKIYQRRVRARAIRARAGGEGVNCRFPEDAGSIIVCRQSQRSLAQKPPPPGFFSGASARFYYTLANSRSFSPRSFGTHQKTSPAPSENSDPPRSLQLRIPREDRRARSKASRYFCEITAKLRARLFRVKRLLNDSLSINRYRDTLAASLRSNRRRGCVNSWSIVSEHTSNLTRTRDLLKVSEAFLHSINKLSNESPTNIAHTSRDRSTLPRSNRISRTTRKELGSKILAMESPRSQPSDYQNSSSGRTQSDSRVYTWTAWALSESLHHQIPPLEYTSATVYRPRSAQLDGSRTTAKEQGEQRLVASSHLVILRFRDPAALVSAPVAIRSTCRMERRSPRVFRHGIP